MQQVSGDLVQQLPVVLQNFLGLPVALANDLDGLPVRRCVGLLGAGHGVAAVQVLALHSPQGHHVKLVAHTEPGHQVSRQLRGPLNVVGCAGGHGVADNLLTGAACQQRADFRQNVLLGHEELLLLRQVQGVAQSPLGVGDDGDFAHGLGIFLLGGHQGVAHLVIGDDALFLVGDNGALLLRAGNDHLEGHQQVVLIHGLTALAHRPEGGLVHQVCQVCTHAAGGGLGNLFQIHILGQMDVAGVDL